MSSPVKVIGAIGHYGKLALQVAGEVQKSFPPSNKPPLRAGLYSAEEQSRYEAEWNARVQFRADEARYLAELNRQVHELVSSGKSKLSVVPQVPVVKTADQLAIEKLAIQEAQLLERVEIQRRRNELKESVKALKKELKTGERPPRGVSDTQYVVHYHY